MLMLLSQFEDLTNNQGFWSIIQLFIKEVILSNCQMKTNKKDAKTQNKIKNMQNAKEI